MNHGWRWFLNWLQPVLLAALTGGIFFVGGSGRRAVESTSNEWAGVYTRTVRELIETEEARDKCAVELQAYLSSVPSG